jgi:hypothetical protein
VSTGRTATRLAAMALLVMASSASRPPAAAGASAWPAETWAASTNLTSLNPTGWSKNLSGAYWNPATRRLWVCTNSPPKFWSLVENGSGGFAIEHEYTGTGDLEGVTQAGTAADLVFVVDEQARILRSYRISDGAALTTWFLGSIPDWGNSGPEGIAFVPNAWLAANEFRDANGALYPQSVYGANGFGGLLFVAVQTSGWVYAFDLKTDGTYTYVGRYLTSRTESCELTFDATVGRLYVLHNIDGNFLEVTDLSSTVSGSDRRFSSLVEFQVPSASNIEGFALTPALAASGAVGDEWCFFTDDDNASGALRWFRQLHATLARHAGDGQTAGTGAAVPIPPSVRTLDPFSNPLPGFTVHFAVTAGGGAVTGADAVTGESGVATVGSWTLGPLPGTHTLGATGSGLAGSPVSFSATAVDLTAPNASVGAVSPDPRSVPVDTLWIVFSEPVLHFDLADLALTRDAGANLLAGSEPLATQDRTTWSLVVTGLTDAAGTYVLTVARADVTDDAGNPLAAAATGSWTMQGTSAAGGGQPLPACVVLAPPVPNPARGPVRVSFALPSESPVTLAVFDVRGRHVRTLTRGILAAGAHRLDWDGRGEDGAPAPAGWYCFRLQAGSLVLSRRGLRLR